jgi:3D (Asp-Asp-Asp) domain-containing protein
MLENTPKVNRFSYLAALSRLIRAILVAGFFALCWHGAPGDTVQIDTPQPFPSSSMMFEATAYCDHGITKSGVPVETGIVAADPRVLPLGSLIRVENTQYSGVYRVMDTGGLIKGKIIDIFIPSREKALQFGRRQVEITVLRYGYPRPNYAMMTD